MEASWHTARVTRAGLGNSGKEKGSKGISTNCSSASGGPVEASQNMGQGLASMWAKAPVSQVADPTSHDPKEAAMAQSTNSQVAVTFSNLSPVQMELIWACPTLRSDKRRSKTLQSAQNEPSRERWGSPDRQGQES